MTALIDDATRLIEAELARASAPMVLCSFGKDSMVMLHLVRQVRPDVPVIYLRPWEHPSKHAFADRIAAEWGLNISTALPQGRDVVGRAGHVELIEVYQFVEGADFYFPLEAEPGHVPTAESLCSIEKMNAPIGAAGQTFDCVFVGHRADDLDPIHGPIRLIESATLARGGRIVYPLKEWTAADVWAYSRAAGVPQNEARYAGDMGQNPDYWPLCTICLEPGEGERVHCPKVDDWVYRLGNVIDLASRTARWRQHFVNLENPS